VVAETPLAITLSQHTDKYVTNANLVHSGLGDKWFAPAVFGNESGVSIWSMLGFADNQILNSKKKGNVQTLVDEVKSALAAGSVGTVSATVTQATSDSSEVHLTSTYPSTLENPGGLYITSDKLTSGSTYETRVHPDRNHTEARPENIFEWVQFDVARYYWVQHQSDVLHWHYLNGTTINDFDIKLESQSRVPLSHKNGIGDYHLVLVFETIDHDEYSGDYVRKYNAEGYALAHTPQTIIKP
jgi:hypothetical protein